MPAITRLSCLESMLAATASISLTPAALAQNGNDQTIARADTLIATGQPDGGASTFAQYNDFNPLHPGLDLRSSIAFVLEPLFFYSVLDDKMIPWLAESYEYGEDYTQITVHLRQGVLATGRDRPYRAQRDRTGLLGHQRQGSVASMQAVLKRDGSNANW